MIDPRFALLAALLPVVGSAYYAWNTLKGKTRPNQVSWLLWTVAPLIAFAAQRVERVGVESLLTFAVGFGPALVLGASIVNRNAYWRLTRFDIGCGGVSLVALVLWLVSKTPNVAIVFSILADLFAAIPTVIKSYKHPESESASAYLLSAAGASITLLAIDWGHLTFSRWGFPVYILLVSGAIGTLVLLGKGRSGA